ncbi:hypothetical protein [Halegenticoccus tardaugens]|uniref:hypothetical protein n=1 Tax=Halegenticoccus tardaugens TaxID=2071624 RepID=UPI00100B0427|nr:hypothetical protein [Halegenticoccus tardaugens]
MSKTTHVQTELPDEEYRHFKSLAQERGLSLTAALREATAIWIEQQERVDPDNPLFAILDQLDQEPVPETPRTNAVTEDDLAEEWSEDTAGIRFSGAPDSEE